MKRPESGYDKFFKQAKKAQAAASKQGTPEDMIRAHLASRAKARSAKRPNRKFSVYGIATFLVAAGCGYLGITHPSALDNLKIPTIDIGLFGVASAETKEKPAEKSGEKSTGKTTDHKDEKTGEKTDAAKTAAGPAESAGDHGPDAKAEENLDLRQWTPEELSFFKKLNEKKNQLDRREEELAKLEEELQKQREGIEEKIQQLEKMREQISKTLKERVVQDQEKVAKLVDVYSSMKPSQAAKVIETLNEDLAVTILDKMKKKSAAEILNTMAAPKARKLSEMLTGYQIKGEGGESSSEREPASTTK